ncbi:acyltransferase [Novosphingobium sp. P6W]|uniref:acyltransferase family protein n=1 Tax=Novosphingobium sp. P6W TaxID=1609758 RepID=UPI000698E529|nr:acyltransferase [Novosphingobium sp. P6W]AXB77580.1 acyltransferase [Novosphingobium sp. P6W]
MDAIARAADMDVDAEAPDAPDAARTIAATRHFALPQALRGLAALWVVLFHLHSGGHASELFARAPRAVVWIFAHGESGVAVFFALSGFVIAHSLRDATPSLGLLSRFVLRRAIRLDPPYWAAILTVLCLGFIEYRIGHAPAPDVTGPQLAAHLVYAQSLLGFQNINIVFWTLCYEVQFYIFFVISLLVAHKFGAKGRAGVRLLHFGIAAIWAAGYFSSPFEGLFVDLWFAFYLGVLAYRAPRSRIDAAQMAVLFVPVALSQSPFGWVAFITALVLAVSLATGFVKDGLRSPPLLFLGTISYSLYLFHNPVTGAGFFVASILKLPDLAAIVTVLAVNVAVAWAAYRLVEAPAHALSKRITLP